MQEAVEKQDVLGDFDPRVVHYRDRRTKQITEIKAFTVIIDEGRRFYEYPKGSGNLWYEDRTPAGRWEAQEGKPGKKIVVGAEHKAWVPPISADEAIRREHEAALQRAEAAEKELAAIKAEAEKAAGHTTKKQDEALSKQSSKTKTAKI